MDLEFIEVVFSVFGLRIDLIRLFDLNFVSFSFLFLVKFVRQSTLRLDYEGQFFFLFYRFSQYFFSIINQFILGQLILLAVSEYVFYTAVIEFFFCLGRFRFIGCLGRGNKIISVVVYLSSNFCMNIFVILDFRKGRFRFVSFVLC